MSVLYIISFFLISKATRNICTHSTRLRGDAATNTQPASIRSPELSPKSRPINTPRKFARNQRRNKKYTRESVALIAPPTPRWIVFGEYFSNVSFDLRPAFLFCYIFDSGRVTCLLSARELLATNLHFHFFLLPRATRPAFGETWPLASASAVIGGAPQESGFSARRSLSVIVLSLLVRDEDSFGEYPKDGARDFPIRIFSTFHAKSPHRSARCTFDIREESGKTCVCEFW